MRIGDRVFCNDAVYVNHHVTIEDKVSVGQFRRLITAGHELGPEGHPCRPDDDRAHPHRPGCLAWRRCHRSARVSVGAGCVIASGAVVTRDPEPNGLYAGVPAVRKRDLPTD